MEQKKNDWVATLFFNSDKSLQELANLGFTVENSDIKDKSYYKLKPEIQQAFVKENKISVEKHVAEVAKQLGGTIAVKGYFRFEKGEGLEKKQENFAEEIAKQLGQA